MALLAFALLTALDVVLSLLVFHSLTTTPQPKGDTMPPRHHHMPTLPPAPPVRQDIDLPPGEAFARWLAAIKRRHFRALIHHPHHYAVAAGLSLGLFAVGHWESGAVMAAWLYAFVENVATAAEAVVFDA